MADGDFVTAVGPDGKKRLVPKHYLDNPALGEWKLPPSTRNKQRAVREPANSGQNARVTEPAKPENEKEASE